MENENSAFEYWCYAVLKNGDEFNFSGTTVDEITDDFNESLTYYNKFVQAKFFQPK